MTSQRRRLRHGPTPSQPSEGQHPPVHFRYEDWADESEIPPAHWGNVDRWPNFHHLRALRRYQDTVRTWRQTNGISWEAWQAMRQAR